MVDGLKPELGPLTQTGEFVASAGSIVSVTFDKPFNGTPVVVASVVGGLSEHPAITTSGFTVDVETASASGSYIAYY